MAKKKNIPDTSKEAYKSLNPDEIRGAYRDIMIALSVLIKGTFEDISAYLGEDKSRIWKRLSEMERMGLIFRPGSKKVLKSGRQGYEWALTSNYIPKTEASEKALKGEAIVDYPRKLIPPTYKQLDLL